MTKDEALTMIIASIAMEELALSHIVNAEGEKLQYVLKTLPGGHGICANAQEILAVNRSVKDLLDTVAQSQMLLKGKLEKALEAGGRPPVPELPCPGEPGRPCGPEPSCPCQPTPPCGAEPSCPCKPAPPCGAEPACPCGRSAIQLAGRCRELSWNNGSLMSWTCQAQLGCGIRWSEKMPVRVSLDTGRAYALSCVMNVRDPYPEGSTGMISVKVSPENAFSGVLPLYFSTKCLECKPLTLHYSATLFPLACPMPGAELSLFLDYRDRLFVEQASLSIVEL